MLVPGMNGAHNFNFMDGAFFFSWEMYKSWWIAALTNAIWQVKRCDSGPLQNQNARPVNSESLPTHWQCATHRRAFRQQHAPPSQSWDVAISAPRPLTETPQTETVVWSSPQETNKDLHNLEVYPTDDKDSLKLYERLAKQHIDLPIL
jgi:hypothetical protein